MNIQMLSKVSKSIKMFFVIDLVLLQFYLTVIYDLAYVRRCLLKQL